MNLTVLSHTLEMGILYLPRLVIALLIFGIGWMIAGWVAGAIQRALIKERVPRATLVSRFAKAVLVLFFSTMALTELSIAPEIVVIGFTTMIVTLGAITVVFVARGGKGLVTKVLDTFDDDDAPPARSSRKSKGS